MSTEPTTVVYQGKRYRLWHGRLLLDWHNKREHGEEEVFGQLKPE